MKPVYLKKENEDPTYIYPKLRLLLLRKKKSHWVSLVLRWVAAVSILCDRLRSLDRRMRPATLGILGVPR